MRRIDGPRRQINECVTFFGPEWCNEAEPDADVKLVPTATSTKAHGMQSRDWPREKDHPD